MAQSVGAQVEKKFKKEGKHRLRVKGLHTFKMEKIFSGFTNCVRLASVHMRQSRSNHTSALGKAGNEKTSAKNTWG